MPDLHQKLALGTAQFGMSYGVANHRGQVSPDEACELLRLAQNSGINTVDTAISYGDSEAVLGECLCDGLQIFTKLPPVPEACAPMDYYIQLKMQRACRYLAHSDRKIKVIARELGYDDQYYFSRLFSKAIGKSPSDYRREERGA